MKGNIAITKDSASASGVSTISYFLNPFRAMTLYFTYINVRMTVTKHLVCNNQKSNIKICDKLELHQDTLHIFYFTKCIGLWRSKSRI